MCYNAAHNTNRGFQYAIAHANTIEEKNEFERKYLEWKKSNAVFAETYFTSAFSHDDFLVVYQEGGFTSVDQMQWGLIPRWCNNSEKSSVIQNQTINARSETMFEKPAYRQSALDRRCIILMTGFFEFHHQGRRKYPLFIQQRKGEIMAVAGIWDEAEVDEKKIRSFSVVTVEANESMAKIHNNPKNPHRMPLILNPDQFRLWLTALEKDDVISKKMVSNLMQPYPSQDLSYSTVPPLLGNHGVGNNPAAQQNFVYIDLELEI